MQDLNSGTKAFQYSEDEEKANAFTHFVGAIFALYVIGSLSVSAFPLGTLAVFSYAAFGFSLLLMYTCSTFYHLEKKEMRKLFMKKLDHMAIFILIAGSITPFLIVNMGTVTAYWYTAGIWAYAIAGILFKLLTTKPYKKLSLFMYLFMGWSALFIWSDLKAAIPQQSLDYILFGGLSYSIGTIFYAMKRVRHHHMVWHLFVMGGTFLHFLAIRFSMPV